MALSLKWVKVGTKGDGSIIEFNVISYSTEQHKRLHSIAFGDKYSGNDKGLKYAQYFIKFTVKDWRTTYPDGREEPFLIYDNGIKVKCELENNELKEDIWWELVSDIAMAMGIFTTIKPLVELNDTDKKKLSSLQFFKETGSSEAKEETTQ